MYYYIRRNTPDYLPGLIAFVVVVFFFGPLLHELGHILVIMLQGSQLVSFQMYGIQLYPVFGPGQFQGAFTGSAYDQFYGGATAAGLRLLAGSGFTFLVALMGVGLSFLFSLSSKFGRMFLFSVALYGLDLVSFTFLPRFGGGHLGLGFLGICPVEKGCEYSEPLLAAEYFGWSPFWFQVAVVMLTLILVTLLILRIVLLNKRSVVLDI